MPAAPHVCPECSYERPCFFDEGEIVSLSEDREDEVSLWTGIVLRVEKDPSGEVYRVHWGSPSPPSGMSAAVAAKHTGAHRGAELRRFLVPLVESAAEIRFGGDGAREARVHKPVL